MERQPYFQVGEEVILQSEFAPQDNGECVVEWLAFRKGPVQTSFGDFVPSTFVYVLSNRTGIWLESALRKKYPPASQGFSELISSIKQNEHA